MADKVRLTKRNIDLLEPTPGVERRYVLDAGNDGLAVCVLSSGRKVFYCVRRAGRRMVRVRLGLCDTVPLERARKEAKRIAADIAGGRDPQAEKVERRNTWTVAEAIEHYLDRERWSYQRPRGNKPLSARSVKNYRWLLATHLEPFAARQLHEISTQDVLLLRDHIRSGTAPTVANQILALLRALYQHAAQENCFQGVNPVNRVGRYPDVERQRFLSREETTRLLSKLESEDQWFRVLVNVLLLTGQRRGSCLQMRWEHVDLVSGQWWMPTTKSQVPHCVPLVPRLVTMLREWRPFSDGEWVFPSRLGVKSKTGGHVADFTTKWRALCSRIGLDGVRIHDLRHSTASMLARNGESLLTIGKLLGHKSPRSTIRYAHLDMTSIRAATERAVIAALGGDDTEAK